MDLKYVLPIFVVAIGCVTSAIVVATVFVFLHRAKELKHQTVRFALEKGLPVPPGLLDTGGPRRGSDLGRGVKLVSLGLGLSAFFWSFQPNLWSIGLIPGFIGVGHLVAHALTGRRAPDAPAAQ